MSYTQQTWTTGEIITEEKLNHMEEGIANAGGEPVDVGYECSDPVTTTLFDGSVTTADNNGVYSGTFTMDDPEVESLTLTLNGTEYTLNQYTFLGMPCYTETEPDPNEHLPTPAILFTQDGTYLFTASEGTFTVKVEGTVETVTVSECFAKAVSSVTGFKVEGGITTLFEGSVTTEEAGEVYAGTFTMDDPEVESLTLTLDGTEYTLNRYIVYDMPYYTETEPDPNEAPPLPTISFTPGGTGLVTATAGTYDVKIEADETTITTTPQFCAAVNNCVGGVAPLIATSTYHDTTRPYRDLDVTFGEIKEAVLSGRNVLIKEVGSLETAYYPLADFSAGSSGGGGFRVFKYDENTLSADTYHADSDSMPPTTASDA